MRQIKCKAIYNLRANKRSDMLNSHKILSSNIACHDQLCPKIKEVKFVDIV